jgi:DNA-directed RNA polymerase specialized sigma24 family protein
MQSQSIPAVRPVHAARDVREEEGPVITQTPEQRDEIHPEPAPKLEVSRTRPVKPEKMVFPAANPSPQDKRAVILDLAEQGFSVTDIAQKMGVGKGEVMLLLKLRKKAIP